MSFSDIQTPLQINFAFMQVDSSSDQYNHKYYPLTWVLEMLPNATLPKSTQHDINKLLGQSLVDYFNAQIDLGTAKSMLHQAIQNAIPNATRISITFPTQKDNITLNGTVRAQVSNLSPGMLDTLPPGGSGRQLTLGYLLSGVKVTFNETTSGIWGSWADPEVSLTFDAEVAIYIAVPDTTRIPLGVRAQFLMHNMQAGPENFFAGLVGLEDLISAYLNDQPGGFGSSLQDQSVALTLPPQLSDALGMGFAAAVPFGFVQLGVQISTTTPISRTTPPLVAEDPTVEFDLTHPFDPGPVVTNALSSEGMLFGSPQIGTSAPQVNAGGQLGVTGNYFPAAQSNELAITWNDTTSGTVVQSEVEWGPVPTAPSQPFTPQKTKFARQGPEDHANIFVAKGLTPNTSYAFRVRDYDVSDLIATNWSAWIALTTAATDHVQLVLEDGNNTVIGFATVQADRTFVTTVTVPPNEPPGTYELLAVLAGQLMAHTTITVVAAGQALSPVLQVLDPYTGMPVTSTPGVMGLGPVRTRGLNFNPGTVDLFVDSISGTSLGSATADQNGSFTVTLTWPLGMAGPHTILAQQNTLQATVPVFGDVPPN